MSMYLPFLFSLFLFGLIIGSFLNVYILRINTGKDTKGRSACASCGRQLNTYELIPVLSFLFLKGRCLKCKTKISIQYPTVELLNAFLYSLIFIFVYDKVLAFMLLPLASLTLAASVYDVKHKIIPQQLINLIFINSIVILLYKFYISYSFVDILDFVFNIILSQLFYSLPIFAIWFLSRGKAMGFADLKLSAALAFVFFTPYQAWISLTLSFVLGAVFSLFLLSVYKLKNDESLNFKSEIAFGPFIASAFWLTIIFHDFVYAIITL